MHASRTCHLRDARDRRFDIRGRGLHQICQLIDDDDDVRNSLGNFLFIFARHFDRCSVRGLNGPAGPIR
jgi:hypothetical protein